MRKILAAALVFLSAPLFASNIIHLWSIGDIGVDYSDRGGDGSTWKNVSFEVTFLKFNWIDTKTGVGFNLSITGYRYPDNEMALPFPPMEVMWNPVSVTTPVGYLNWGIYDRVARFGKAVEDGQFENSIGMRFIFSSHPFGKTPSPHRGNYHVNRTLFLEYVIGDLSRFDPAQNRVRIGVTMDIGVVAITAINGGASLVAWPFTNSEARKGR
jgi:hypothetical protein